MPPSMRGSQEQDLGPDHACGDAHSLLIGTVEEQIVMKGIQQQKEAAEQLEHKHNVLNVTWYAI